MPNKWFAMAAAFAVMSGVSSHTESRICEPCLKQRAVETSGNRKVPQGLRHFPHGT
jgi:hypothetical protein